MSGGKCCSWKQRICVINGIWGKDVWLLRACVFNTSPDTGLPSNAEPMRIQFWHIQQYLRSTSNWKSWTSPTGKRNMCSEHLNGHWASVKYWTDFGYRCLASSCGEIYHELPLTVKKWGNGQYGVWMVYIGLFMLKYFKIPTPSGCTVPRNGYF